MNASRKAVVLALILFAGITLSPGVLYLVSLAQIDHLPEPVSPSGLSESQLKEAWRTAGESSDLTMQPLNPWGYTYYLFRHNPDSRPAGLVAAWRVAARHNLAHLDGHAWWHPSGAALTIWISRHWSAEQVAATLIAQQSQPIDT